MSISRRSEHELTRQAGVARGRKAAVPPPRVQAARTWRVTLLVSAVVAAVASSVTWLIFGLSTPSSAVLEQVFTGTVEKVSLDGSGICVKPPSRDEVCAALAAGPQDALREGDSARFGLLQVRNSDGSGYELLVSLPKQRQ